MRAMHAWEKEGKKGIGLTSSVFIGQAKSFVIFFFAVAIAVVFSFELPDLWCFEKSSRFWIYKS